MCFLARNSYIFIKLWRLCKSPVFRLCCCCCWCNQWKGFSSFRPHFYQQFEQHFEVICMQMNDNDVYNNDVCPIQSLLTLFFYGAELLRVFFFGHNHQNAKPPPTSNIIRALSPMNTAYNSTSFTSTAACQHNNIPTQITCNLFNCSFVANGSQANVIGTVDKK